MDDTITYTAFAGDHRLASGSLADVTAAVTAAMGRGAGDLVVFADQNGRTIEIDTRPDAMAGAGFGAVATSSAKPARGRPKLGV